MRRLVFFGNCQAEAYMRLYRQHVQRETGDEVTYISNYRPISEQQNAAVATADVVIMQVFDQPPAVKIDNMPPSAKIIEFPTIFLSFLWPGCGRRRTLKDMPRAARERYGLELGDEFLDRCINANMSPNEAIKRYFDADFSKNLDRMLEICLERLEVADERMGFSLQALIEKGFRNEQMVYSPGHLCLRLSRHMVRETFSRLDLSADRITHVLDSMIASPFQTFMRPIHPSVVTHFGLPYGGRDVPIEFDDGQSITHEDYLYRYLTQPYQDDLWDCIQAAKAPTTDVPLDQLIARLRASISRHAPSSTAESVLGRLLMRQGDTDTAITAFQRASAIGVPSVPIHRQLVDALRSAGRDVEAGIALARYNVGEDELPTYWKYTPSVSLGIVAQSDKPETDARSGKSDQHAAFPESGPCSDYEAFVTRLPDATSTVSGAAKPAAGWGMHMNLEDNKLDFVVVSFRGDFPALLLQARSITRSNARTYVKAYYIIWNDDHSREEFDEQFLPKIAAELHGSGIEWKTLLCSEMISKDFLKTFVSAGDRIQQILKLFSARVCTSDIICVLDSKNHIIRPLAQTDFISPDGRLRSHSQFYSPEGPFNIWYRMALDYCLVDDSGQKVSGRPGLPSTTPYVMSRKIMLDLLDFVERKEGIPFEIAFMKSKEISETHEFLLYCAFVTKTAEGFENVYQLTKRTYVTFFNRSPVGEAAIEATVKAMDSEDIKFIGFHRRRTERLTETEKNAFIGLWLKAGLFDSEVSANIFLDQGVLR